ncbi:Glutamine synthetase [Bacillus cereus Rock3-28]|nr:Glutamine synthetase [Bacillus cereus Rock3-28]
MKGSNKWSPSAPHTTSFDCNVANACANVAGKSMISASSRSSYVIT